ncbi:MAG: hypothetical protein Q8K59_00600 [Nitrosomonas sp.]|nr:hypothetical protein [Nitrosomonas sp.]
MMLLRHTARNPASSDWIGIRLRRIAPGTLSCTTNDSVFPRCGYLKTFAAGIDTHRHFVVFFIPAKRLDIKSPAS